MSRKRTTQVVAQEYATVSVDELKPHPQNARQGDLGSICESIDANGFYGAIVAQQSMGYILAGNHRWRAAIARGLKFVPVLWLDVDDATALRILL
jgi:ParB-like chromosome segregation protein Spo0J